MKGKEQFLYSSLAGMTFLIYLTKKIVLATNIAESSITIDDVVYVIDCGKAKETSYDALNKLACLLPSWISKASAHQRRGRAGRVRPGVFELLKTIGALDDMEELTPLGRHLCKLPLDPNIGKMLLMGSIFQCLNPALTIAAALAHRDPFVLPINRKEEANAAKRSFAGDSCRMERCKMQWEGKDFCWENFLSPITLQMMDDMRNQFLDLLSDIGFVDKSKVQRRGKRTAFYTKEVGKLTSIQHLLMLVFIFPLPYMVYSEKVKTASIFVRDSTNISDYSLLLFGGNLIPSETGEGIEMLGGYLHFSASKSVLELIRKLRSELDKLLKRKIEEPGLDISAEGKEWLLLWLSYCIVKMYDTKFCVLLFAPFSFSLVSCN
ncbi:DExH-box ATP-dependent RNA helicase DExH1 [Vitis vinifera]|uniref:RNA helicase n=1 Tax=Vitis vinifera TaxID=29760 RepID=A0A438CUX3_VITVI|nr:DExH-box ATP-dependent RNA helicase DExH1 [Vitis vinifera]